MALYKNFDLKKITWFQIGGIAENFASVDNTEELKTILKEYTNCTKYIIGACSNTLVYDGFINGLVIRLTSDKNDNFNKILFNSNRSVTCGSAVTGKDLAMNLANHKLSGLEFCYTIPGTVGGMIKMNAGCYGSEIKDVLQSIKVIDFDGNVQDIPATKINFEYRKSNLPNDCIILEATFNVKYADSDTILSTITEMKRKRLESQIIGSTCGSTFKNHSQYKAWQIIDKIGLRGYQVGGAKFSEKHCNFIVTNGKATYDDVRLLIEKAQDVALKELNIKLDKEIVFLPEIER